MEVNRKRLVANIVDQENGNDIEIWYDVTPETLDEWKILSSMGMTFSFCIYPGNYSCIDWVVSNDRIYCENESLDIHQESDQTKILLHGNTFLFKSPQIAEYLIKDITAVRTKDLSESGQ